MKWEQEDIVEYLVNDYCRHFENREKYLKNDNQVDADWEAAVTDYIFSLLKTITQGSDNDVATMLDEKLEGVFVFDPQDNPKFYKVKVNKDYFAAQDIYYCSIEDLYGSFTEEEIDFLNEDEILDINSYSNEVYIPKGTRMTYLGSDPTASGWPTFSIHGFEFDFAGDPFKLKEA